MARWRVKKMGFWGWLRIYGEFEYLKQAWKPAQRDVSDQIEHMHQQLLNLSTMDTVAGDFYRSASELFNSVFERK